MQPQCFVNCIGKIRLHGFIGMPEKPREDNPIDYLVHIRKIALPLYPQFGTEPNVYYIPPLHVKEEFLTQMFGPSVEVAKQAYLAAKDDPVLLGCLLLFGAAPRTIHAFRVKGDTAMGFDEKGDELCRVPLREPVYIRPYFDEARAVHRHNIS
jgi:nitrate reductase beta subunit